MFGVDRTLTWLVAATVGGTGLIGGLMAVGMYSPGLRRGMSSPAVRCNRDRLEQAAPPAAHRREVAVAVPVGEAAAVAATGCRPACSCRLRESTTA